jgi:hypothetical protein
MLSIDHFPVNHVGICKRCTQQLDQPSHSSTVHESTCPSPHTSFSPGQDHTSQTLRKRRQSKASSPIRKQVTGSFLPRPRRDRHATLSRSVTAYSDTGEYPSGRSTYGVSKPSQKRLHKRQTQQTTWDRLRVQQSPAKSQTNPLSQLQNRAVDKQLDEVESLWQYLTRGEISALQQRKADKEPLRQAVKPGAKDNNSSSGYLCKGIGDMSPQETSNQSSLQDTLPAYLTPTVRQRICDICEVWGVQNITDIFPRDIWPKVGTVWNLAVLGLFLTMARQYPTQECCDGISGKFTDLITARRHKLNAKTQWTIQDADATYTWAKSEYGLPVPEQEEVEDSDSDNEGVRSSQRQRIPSKKAIALFESKGKRRAPRGVIQALQESANHFVISSSSSEVNSEEDDID